MSDKDLDDDNRRDEVLKRMLNTKPQKHKTKEPLTEPTTAGEKGSGGQVSATRHPLAKKRG
jgi:hypothetical protein